MELNCTLPPPSLKVPYNPSLLSRPSKCDSAICAPSRFPFGLTFGGTLITLVIVAVVVVVEGDEAELDAAAPDALGAAEADAAPPHC